MLVIASAVSFVAVQRNGLAQSTLMTITIRGSVEQNNIPIGQPGTSLAYVNVGDQISVSFDVDVNNYMNSPTSDPRGTGQLLDTRGYYIDPTSFVVNIAQSTMHMYQPWPLPTGPFFVVRTHDYTVDGFFGSAGTDTPTTWYTDNPDYLGNGIDFEDSFNQIVFGTRDILATQGTWGYYSNVNGAPILGAYDFEFNGALGPAMLFNFDSTTIKLKTANFGWAPQAGTAWSNASNWTSPSTPQAPNSAAHSAVFPAASSPQAVTVDAALTVNEIDIAGTGSYTFSGAGSLTMAGVGTTAGIFVTQGSHTIGVPATFTATNSTIEVETGASLYMASVTAVAGTTLSKTGQGTLAVGALDVDHLDIQGDGDYPHSGVLALPTATPIGSGTTTVAVANSLTLANGAGVNTFGVYYSTLDVGTSALVLHNADATTAAATESMVISAIRSGYGQSGTWDGYQTVSEVSYGRTISFTGNFGGITSSAAAAAVAAGNPIYAVGSIVNSDGAGGALYASFDGVPVTSTDVLTMFTYVGDTTLKGYVDGTDLANLLAGMSGGLTGWENGDLNYDGVVDAADMELLLTGLQGQGVALGGGSHGGGGAVPEPTLAGWIFAGGLGLAARRRSR
jgi:hypothetical protein